MSRLQSFSIAQNGLIDFEDTHIKQSVPEIPRGALTSHAGGAVLLEWYGDGLTDTSLKVIHGPDWQPAPLQIPSDRPRRCQPAEDLSLNESGRTRSHTSLPSASNGGNCKDNMDERQLQSKTSGVTHIPAYQTFVEPRIPPAMQNSHRMYKGYNIMVMFSAIYTYMRKVTLKRFTRFICNSDLKERAQYSYNFFAI